MKVLIAVDGSECSKEAVDFVARRPWAPDDVFLMLHVIEPIPVDVGIAYIPAGYLIRSRPRSCMAMSRPS